ncbi:hypothetical protein [Methanobacterium formicicum]|jgi:hypothetical protein|uniref:Membrane protein n=1 Tax=Methanobacterium formicicum TaxID=2162 RepID=A0A0S4FPL7_METFO|nr:hypothetical protein [Methanobacterium formicicum]CEL25019.1 putative membrane protein [Methanobacterium formicicum]
MNQKIIVIAVVLVVAFSGLAVLEVSNGFISGLVFDQIPYNYTAKVWIPPTHPEDPNSGSLGGFYKINGQGRDFNFFLQLSGAEKSESPLDYTADGLKGTGRLDEIKITFGTILSLLNKDVKGAMFNTTFKGHMNLTCAAWTGVTYFQNDAQNFTGNFTIDGTMTDWEGNYTLKRENIRILGVSDFIYYPNNQRSAAKKVQKSYYL